jgi:hypothetical protein
MEVKITPAIKSAALKRKILYLFELSAMNK